MGYLAEKAAYLKGLCEGMKLAEKGDEGKLLEIVIEALEEFAESIDDLNDVVEECEDRIDDLEDFADEIYEDMCDCDDDCCCDDDCDCDCDDDCCCGEFDEYTDEDLEDMEFYEVECPHCNEKVYFDEDMLDSDDLVCPNCDGTIEIELDG